MLGASYSYIKLHYLFSSKHINYVIKPDYLSPSTIDCNYIFFNDTEQQLRYHTLSCYFLIIIRKKQNMILRGNSDPRQISILFMGYSAGGKSSLIQRYVNNSFERSPPITIGVDFLSKSYKDIRVKIWDSAGQQRFRIILQSFIKSMKYFIVVYDVTDVSQVNKVAECLKHMEETVRNKQQIRILLLGNKTDLLQKGQVSIIPQIQKIYSSRPNVTCRTTSCKDQKGNTIQLINQFVEQCTQQEKIRLFYEQKRSIYYNIESLINKIGHNIQLMQLYKEPNYTKRMESVFERLKKKKNLQEIALISELINDFKNQLQFKEDIKLKNQQLRLQLEQKNKQILKLKQEVFQLRSSLTIYDQLSQKNIEYQYWLYQAKQFISSNLMKNQIITPKIRQFLKFVDKIDEEQLPINVDVNSSLIFGQSESFIANNMHKLKEKLQAEKQLQIKQFKGPLQKLHIMEEIIEDLIQSSERQQQIMPVGTEMLK